MTSALDGSPTVAEPAPRRQRITSLDWARGIMLIASVGVNSLVAAPGWFNHAPWEGVHPEDVIFPVFVTLSGCGLAFAMHQRVTVGPLLKRFAILMLAGLVYNAIVLWSFDVATWRVTGVLQLYAVLVALMGLLHLVTKSWQGWAALTVLLAAAHTSILGAYARSCPGGVLARECNPSGPLDTLLFGAAHIYREGTAGHDPEGVMSILGAMVSAAAGATVGHLLLSRARRGSSARERLKTAAAMLAVAFGFVLLLVALRLGAQQMGFQLDFIKRIWTAPFALIIAAATTVLLVLGHLLLDGPRVGIALRAGAYPLIALGRNSLLVYFGSHILMSLLARSFNDQPSIAQRVFAAMPEHWPAQTVWTLGLLAFWIILAALLHWRRIYLRP